jgi:hypothetical protein
MILLIVIIVSVAFLEAGKLLHESNQREEANNARASRSRSQSTEAENW